MIVNGMFTQEHTAFALLHNGNNRKVTERTVEKLDSLTVKLGDDQLGIPASYC